jgi:hypothetical protein
MQILQVHFVTIHFVYALIYDRLRTRFHPNCFSIRWEELIRLMSSTDIRLSPETLELFRQSLMESGIFCPREGRIDISLLLMASQSLSRIYQEECKVSLRDQEKRKLESARNPSSTCLRNLQTLRPKWPNMRAQMLRSSRREDISLSDFTHSVTREGGVVISPRDLHELWRYIAFTGNYDWSFEADRDLLLPIGLFDQVLKSPEANYSSLSALMRDPIGKPSGLKCDQPSSNKEDHVTSLLITNDPILSRNPSYRPIVSPFPWQRNETALVSNVRQRVIDGLQRTGHRYPFLPLSHSLPFLDPRQTKHFARSLMRAEKTRIALAGLETLPRGVLLEALASFAIHLSRTDAQDLWDEITASCKGHLRAADILRWLGVEVPSPESDDRAEPIAPLEPTPSPSPQDFLIAPRKAISLASFHSPTPRDSVSRHSPPWLLQVIQSLLKHKSHLAFTFRSCGGGSGIISAADLCHALRQPPFQVALDDNALWQFVYRIASMDPSVPPASVFLRYSEVVNYLEAELQRLFPSASSSLSSSLRQKLEQSRYVQGIPSRVVGHLQILRQRLRNLQQRGAVTSWEGVPDMCSVREFVALLQSIDLEISLEEADLIWAESRKSGSEESSWNFLTGSGDDGVRAISIGAGLAFLESLLTSQ